MPRPLAPNADPVGAWQPLFCTAKNMKKTIAYYSLLKSAGALFCLIFLWGQAWATPVVQRWQDASGAQVALVSSPGIPMLDVRLDFDGGSRRDPTSQAGLAAVTALMSQRGVVAGGAADQANVALGENELTERWMDLGAQWSVSAGADQFSATLRTLSAPDVLPQAVALAARQLAHPRWSGDEAQAIWQRERERLVAAWHNASTQPATVAQRRFAAAVYGQHPYGQEATPDTLARIGLADMQRHWQSHVRACQALITLVGDVDRAGADTIVRQLMAPLQATETDRQSGASHCAQLPPVPEVAPLAVASDIRVPLRTAQAHVLLGQPGHPRNDPDYFPLLLGNYILGGGGFVSRLTTEVREKRGLSYGVYSYFMPGRHAGAFQVGLQTRPDQAEQALAVAREVVNRFVQEGPTDAEVLAAKTYMANSFAMRIDTNRKLLDNVANMQWHGLPPDYLDTWVASMQAVSVSDIRRAFARVLQTQRMVSVVVGGQGG